MPVSNEAIKQQINVLINQTKTLEQEQSQEQFASGLANIITEAILSATVTILPGVAVQVAVPAGTGSTIAFGTGSLS